jgi:hypothetical protein
MNMRTVAVLLSALGLAQMGADAWGLRPLKAVAAATAAAPAPKVFGDVRGFETFSNEIVASRRFGSEIRRERLNRAYYRKLAGPYNRRNIYGAAIAYGPVLDEALRDPVIRRALCRGADSVTLEYASLSALRRSASPVEVSCK